MAEQTCPAGVDPADVAAWMLDGDEHPQVDLESHVPTCFACRRVAERMGRTRAVVDALRAESVEPPRGARQRTLSRLRFEAFAVDLLRAVLGGTARVVTELGPGLPPPRPPDDGSTT